MLNEDERRELDRVARDLAEDDPRLARRLSGRYVRSLPAAVAHSVGVLAYVFTDFGIVLLGLNVHLIVMSILGALLLASTPVWFGRNLLRGWRRR